MIVLVDLGPVAGHLRRALLRYERHLRADGLPLPHALRQLLELTASSGQQRPSLGHEGDAVDDQRVAQLFTLDEVADRLRVGERTVRRFTSSGRLPTVKLGAAVRVHPRDLETFVDSLRPPGSIVGGGVNASHGSGEGGEGESSPCNSVDPPAPTPLGAP